MEGTLIGIYGGYVVIEVIGWIYHIPFLPVSTH
jgi:hypothetical protein